MDLYAYSKIEDFEELAKHNNICIPRLRGYRYMLEEEAVDIEEYINEIRDDITKETVSDALSSAIPFEPESGCYTYDPETDSLKDKYLVYEEGYEHNDFHIKEIKWEEFDETAANRIRNCIEDKLLRYKGQMETFNKYVGRDDVLYVHARIGSGNWLYYEGDKIEQQPWFLEKFDDAFDCTYCDIYCKIEVPEGVNP